MSATERDFAVARDGLEQAMAVVQALAGPNVPYEQKPGGSPVTAADREVDALLRRLLPLPGDGWLSEESEDGPERLRCRRVWIVDPLDGTRSFVAGRKDYSVSVALVVDGEPVLGAIGAPATGVRVTGGPGLGLRIEGDPELPWPAVDGRLRVLASRSETRRGEWAPWQSACQVLPVGSVAYKLALVAGGFADATWTRNGKHEWDVAAGAALVRAAGGEVWLPNGGALQWNRRQPRYTCFAAAAAGSGDRVRELLSRGGSP